MEMAHRESFSGGAPLAEGEVQDRACLRTSLGNYATRIFERNRSHRLSSGVEEELQACLYQSTGCYRPSEIERFKTLGMEPVYFPYTTLKIQTAVAWISEIFLNTTEKVYVLRPTPMPDVPKADRLAAADRLTEQWIADFGGPPQTPEETLRFIYYANDRKGEFLNAIDEQARSRAAGMERLIDDQFHEGGWKRAMGDVIRDMATFGTGILRGPVFRRRKRVQYGKDAQGATTCHLEWRMAMEWHHIDPFDIFPSPGAIAIADGPLCVKVLLLPNELAALRGVEGYDAEKIDALLSTYPNGGLILPGVSDSERREQRNDGGNAQTTTFLEGFEFWGECRGADLLAWGVATDLDGNALTPETYYETNLLVFDGEVIFASLTDERLGRPFYKGTFYEQTGSWWGNSPAKMMRTAQLEMNAAKRNLVFNMAMASGPIKIINDINALQNPEHAVATRPWQTIVGKRTGGFQPSGRPLVEFLQTPSVMGELTNELELCIKHADLLTGIPAYSHGSNVAAGAGRTASGLAMLMDAAQRGIKQVIFSLDRDVMRPSVEYLYRLNLLTSDDAAIKGDCEIDAGGLLAIISRDKNIGLVKEFLVLMQDPNKASVIGEEGLAALMREYARQLGYVNPDDIIPSKEALAARRALALREQQMQMQAQGAPMAQPAPGTPQGLPRGLPLGGAAMMAGATPDPARVGEFQPNGIQASMMEA